MSNEVGTINDVIISFNLFRLAADFLHLFAMLIMLYRIRTLRSCAGISLKTQELYVLVFATRYLDLFWNFSSTYNYVMKIIFLTSTIATVYLMRFKYSHTYDKEHDTFRVLFLIVPSAVLALIFHYDMSISELLWAFSIYLEAVAVLPQLLLVQRTGEVETFSANYIVALGGYRLLYIFNWIYRLFSEPGYRNWIGWLSGIVQTALYADFFYYYFLSKWSGKQLKLVIRILVAVFVLLCNCDLCTQKFSRRKLEMLWRKHRNTKQLYCHPSLGVQSH